MHYSALFAFLFAYVSVVLGMPRWIAAQAKWGGQVVRDEGPKSHHKKKGTPTMGGVVIVSAIVLTVLGFSDWHHDVTVMASLFALLAFALVGWLDDWLKVKHQSTGGLSAKKKIFYQSLIAGVVACLLYPTHQHHHVLVPFMPHLSLELGFWFIPWCWLIVVGGSNAINLTDGLDGLVGSLLVVVMAGLMGVLWLQGGMTPSSLILGLATIGACLGFLWFNGLPASIFMGDVGSLALGGMLSVFALAHHMVLFLSLMGFIFLLEMISVAIQVISFKTRGKRVFRMAPIHHHFEELGWPESKVIVRFWVITCLLVLVGMIGV